MNEIKISSPSIITMQKNDVHMPEWPKWNGSETFLTSQKVEECVWMVQKEISDEFSEAEIIRMDEILEYLSQPNPTLLPSKMRKIEPKCPNICCNRILQVFGEIFCNPKQVCSDTCCCFFVSWTDPEPKQMTWMPQTIFNKMNEIRRDTNRNRAFLVVASLLSLGIPFVPVKMGYETAISQSVVYTFITFSAGIQTFLFVDYGAGELQSCVVSMEGYKHLARYIEKKLKVLSSKEKETMMNQVQQIEKNLPLLNEAMINRGFREEFVSVMLAPFTKVVRKILSSKVD